MCKDWKKKWWKRKATNDKEEKLEKMGLNVHRANAYRIIAVGRKQ